MAVYFIYCHDSDVSKSVSFTVKPFQFEYLLQGNHQARLGRIENETETSEGTIILSYTNSK